MRAIFMRKLTLVNTDPMRRCYNGCHFKSELLWGEWEVLETLGGNADERARLSFWRDLNDYAVSERGRSATREFEVRDITK